jgi:hypothetical protein
MTGDLDDFDATVRGPDDVFAFLRSCGAVSAPPAQVLLGLAVAESDSRAHVVCGAAVRTGPEASRRVDGQELVDLAAALLVGAVVLATVECGGARAPTRHDLARFVALRHVCAQEGVVLLDWVVVTRRHWWSMRERVIHEAA